MTCRITRKESWKKKLVGHQAGETVCLWEGSVNNFYLVKRSRQRDVDTQATNRFRNMTVLSSPPSRPRIARLLRINFSLSFDPAHANCIELPVKMKSLPCTNPNSLRPWWVTTCDQKENMGCTQKQCEINKDIVDNYRAMFESRISAGWTEKLP